MIQAAVIQLKNTMDVEANLATASQFVKEAASAGADFVALPENCAFLGTDGKTPVPAQPLDGPIVSYFRELAASQNIWLLLGSIQEQGSGDGRYRNTSVVLDGTTPGAPITAVYRKLHLFDIDIKGGETQKESAEIEAGDSLVVTSIAGIPTGLSICYDLRFPTMYQRLTAQGARMLTVPAAFTEFTGKDHWLALLRARAIETQTYVIAPNQWGAHGGKRRSFGKSVIFDPWGTALCIAPDRPGWVMARIDLDYQDQVRSSLPCLTHKHPAAHA